jgi:hypothetical protein
MIDDGDCVAIGGIKIVKGNRKTRSKPTPAPICPPQIPHDLTRARSPATVVGSQQLTAWALARPRISVKIIRYNNNNNNNNNSNNMKAFLFATADIVLQTTHATVPNETLPFISATLCFYRKRLRFDFALGFYENGIKTNRQTLLINTELLRLKNMSPCYSIHLSQCWFIVKVNVTIYFRIIVIQLFNFKYYLAS